jgi:integrase
VAPKRYPGIDRLPSGRYRARIFAGDQRFTRTFTTMAAALAWRAKALEALEAGAPLPPTSAQGSSSRRRRSANVEEACRALGTGILEGTVRTRTGTLYKPSVSRKYESMLRLYVVPRLGDVALAGLSKRDVQVMLDGLAAEEGAETARKALTALRVALRVAERDGYLESNPCAGVRVPADNRDPRPVRILAPAECAAIVASAEAMDERLSRSLGGPLFALAFGTGLRSGELLALRWGEEGLDVERGVVSVRRSLDRERGRDGEFEVLLPKSAASRRDVPLPPADAPRLRRHRLAQGRPADGHLVFATTEGQSLGAKGIVRYAWAKAVEQSGIPSPTPTLHDARHAYATHALRAGLTLHAVARLLGHRDVSLVQRRYGHALPDELADAGRMLDRFRGKAG